MQQVIYFLNNEGNTYVQCRDCKYEENGINATSMTMNEMREMYNPIHQEVVIRTKSEMVNLDHAHFRTINHIESKLDHYTCAYCGTRKEK